MPRRTPSTDPPASIGLIDRLPLLYLVAVVGLFAALAVPTFLYVTRSAKERGIDGYSRFWLDTAARVFERHFEHIDTLPITEPLADPEAAELLADVRADELLDLKIWNPDGVLLYSMGHDDNATATRLSHGFLEARGGTAFAEVEAEEPAEIIGNAPPEKILEVYLPVAGPDGETANIVELHYPVSSLESGLSGLQSEFLKLLIILFAGVVALGQGGTYLLARRKRQFEALALEDPLTGLPNRRRFLMDLRAACARDGSCGTLALLLWDVDGLKTINDRLGHPAGDAVLVDVATRLREAAPDHTIARLDGDEFAMLAPVSGEGEAAALASRVLSRFDAPPAPQSIAVTISGGVAVAAAPVRESTLLRRADIAMNSAKQAGGATFVIADKQLEEQWNRRQRLASDLADAVARDELALQYQPIVDLRTEAVVGMESLVRWHHPELGLIPPAEFISLAETTGKIAKIDRWVRRTAFRQTRAWLDRCPSLNEFRIRVNLSAAELGRPGLVDEIGRTLKEESLEPARVEIEVTESTVIRDPEEAVTQLRELRRAGVHTAIDDFGTGYSSLAYLRLLPVSTLKIDRSFVNELENDRMGQTLIAGLVQLGKEFRFDVLAEGIETEAQHALLLRLGCALGQGYLFGRPLDTEAATKVLTAGLAVAT